MALNNSALFAEKQGFRPKKVQLSQALLQFLAVFEFAISYPAAASIFSGVAPKIIPKTYGRFFRFQHFWHNSPMNIKYCPKNTGAAVSTRSTPSTLSAQKDWG
ncbi:MAG TPA: hypothetical protein VGO59_16690 [Verrucomicrobiae bacterium]|jgi:hypothetical protein